MIGKSQLIPFFSAKLTGLENPADLQQTDPWIEESKANSALEIEYA